MITTHTCTCHLTTSWTSIWTLSCTRSSIVTSSHIMISEYVAPPSNSEEGSHHTDYYYCRETEGMREREGDSWVFPPTEPSLWQFLRALRPMVFLTALYHSHRHHPTLTFLVITCTQVHGFFSQPNLPCDISCEPYDL